MKKVYINFVPISTGGGLQNAINFLLNIKLDKFHSQEIHFIIRKNDTLIEICKRKNYDFTVIDNGFFARLTFEILFFKDKKNSIIFTLFGTVPFLSWNNFTITGCAYSNLFYPEIDFWGHLKFFQKRIKLLKDYYRYKNISSSDVVIFETETLTNRAISQFKFNSNYVYTVKMAVNSLVTKENASKNFLLNKSKFNILYLGSAHPNKRQHLIVEIIEKIKAKGVNNISIFLTLDVSNTYAKEVLTLIKLKGLSDSIINLGVIPNEKVSSVIDEMDAMINIASLESFSNNFVEAWQMERLLFVTKADWSKDSCGKGAIYLEMDNLDDVSENIIKISQNKEIYRQTIRDGLLELAKYPNAQDKMLNFISIINQYVKRY